MIEGLKPYTEYVIEIASFNVAGEGPPISTSHRTEQAGWSFYSKHFLAFVYLRLKWQMRRWKRDCYRSANAVAILGITVML